MSHPSNSADTGRAFLKTARFMLYTAVFFIPIFFLPISLDVLHLNKQTLLALLILLATLSWLGWMLKTRQFVVKKGWMNVFPAFVLLATIISAFFSIGPYRSWIGAGSQLHASVLSIGALTLLFYTAANLLGRQSHQKIVHMCLLAGGFVAGVLGLLPLLGIAIPFSGTGQQLFNTIGSVNAYGVFMAVMVIFASTLWVSYRTDNTVLFEGTTGVIERLLIFSMVVVGLIALLIIDYWIVWTALIIGLIVLFAFAFLRFQDFSHPAHFVLPSALFAIACLMLFWVPSVYPAHVPTEVTPSYGASWEIAKQTITNDSTMFGSGPGTFLYDYAKYRSADLNETAFWNTRFESAPSFALTQLATVGVFGALFWAIFFLATAMSGTQTILRKKEGGRWLLGYAVFVPWIALMATLFFYTANIVLLFLLFLFAGLFASQGMRESYVQSFQDSPRAGLAFSLAAVLAGFAIVTLVFINSQRYLAEAAFAKAIRLDREGADTQEIVDALDQATRFNRFNDVYQRNLAQAYLARLEEEVENLGSTDRVSEARRNYIQALTSASIDAAKQATERNAPRDPETSGRVDKGPVKKSHDVLNWRVRGSVYRAMIPLINNADRFAVEAFEEATILEPNNPLNYLELAKTHIAVAESQKQLTAAQNPEVREQAQEAVAESLRKAEGNLLKAIELKSEYAPAHFQLGLVFEKQGRIDDAIGKMESVVEFNQMDIGAMFQLGVLYLRRGGDGDLIRAQEQFERLVEFAPAYSNARWFLASVYEQQGELDAAIAQVERVLRLNPGNALVERRLERLQAGNTTEEIPPAVNEEGEAAEGAPTAEGPSAPEEPVE